jgi:hypothetical protein
MYKLFDLSTGAKLDIARMSPIRATNQTAGIGGNGAMKGGSIEKVSLVLLGAVLALYPAAATAQSQTTISLGSADSFAVLGGTTVTNTGLSVVNGNLGVWPGSAVTGFGPGRVNGAEDVGNTAAHHAQSSLTIAYNEAAGRSVGVEGVAGDLGGRTLSPGLYKSTSTLAITGTLTLHGNGIYIFQVASALTVNNGSGIILSGGANAADVFWQVGSSATLGTTSSFKGTILALTAISIATGGTLDGRALARNAAVTLDNDVVTIQVPKSPPPQARNN